VAIMTNLTTQQDNPSRFNLNLGADLFSDPQRDRTNAIVVANHADITADIQAGDLIRIDFTANLIDRDGLYVITLDDNWIGYRRFKITPSLQLIDGMQSCLVNSEMINSIKVIGRVLDIYRSSKI
jgi:hypothetical protein